ncbi:MAG: N-6 DNA methylase, partial [Bacilli bacterium]|nr:N-6 DNA methylase [Bacilli bacterium]
DTLKDDWPTTDINDPDGVAEPLLVDACCSNPPYSQNWDGEEDPRFKNYGVAPKSKADYAFLLHNLYHLNSGGIMAIVLPHGVLFRGGEEGKIREKLIDKNHIEAIIGLPSNMFFGTSIATIIMILKKNRKDSDILFVDASKGFYKDGNKNRLRQRDIRKIVDTVLQKKTIKNYSRLVTKEEIKANDCDLNMSRYVNSNIKELGYDIYSTMFGGIPNYEIDKLSTYWKAFPTLRNQLFEEMDIPYSNIKVKDIKTTILANTEVRTFIDAHTKKFSFLKDFLKTELISSPTTIVISNEISKIAVQLRSRINDDELIEYYDAYEVLSDNWSTISLDLETIKKESLDSAKKIDDVVTFKKNKTTKELDEKVIGSEGRIIPFSLIQNEYFFEDAKQLTTLNDRIAELTVIKEELLSSIDSEDRAQLVKEDSDEIESKKLKSEISKINKRLKSGAEFEEGSYEEIILNIGKNESNLKKCKDEAKVLSTKLMEETTNKLLNLTNEEVNAFLEKKWVIPICNGINELSIRVVEELEREVTKLSKKYERTMVDVETDIKNTESTLIKMIDNLSGDKFDIKGLQEFKKVLGGKKDEQKDSNS